MVIMPINPAVVNIANAVNQAFAGSTRFTGRMAGEVALFRALGTALNAQGKLRAGMYPIVLSDEFHGTHRQVFHAVPAYLGGGTKRCELADLMLVAFNRQSHEAPRVTFLQAKRCSEIPAFVQIPILRRFHGNYRQWSLLHGRPPIIKGHGFDVPSDLLSSATLPSVGSFGIFWPDTGSVGFFYSSARHVGLVRKPGKSPNGPMYLPTTNQCRPVGHLMESMCASSMPAFLVALFSLWVGTPMESTWMGSRWVAAVLGRIVQASGNDAPVVAGLLEYLRTRNITPSDGDPGNPPATLVIDVGGVE